MKSDSYCCCCARAETDRDWIVSRRGKMVESLRRATKTTAREHPGSRLSYGYSWAFKNPLYSKVIFYLQRKTAQILSRAKPSQAKLGH